MSFPELETNRLRLVKIDEKHVTPYFNIMKRADVMKYYGMDALETIEQAAAIVASFGQTFEAGRGIRWGIIHKEDSEFAGTIGLNALNMFSKRTEIGYELHPDYHNRGIMSEALGHVLKYTFEELDLYRTGAVTFPENEASTGLLKRFGFRQEGTLRGYLYQGGRSHDALVFSLLKPEWEKRNLRPRS
ncbi:GNAT family N-acetyltransferase [Alteribacter natronophilus]|uniref:GNAT family N-acetyltransferase n=1 Tax=Alteribacter natronophilus TaxID=2583810 RepID=UPI00110F356D|nr:GNAT family protein [Alteribacter natronophilus]TMW71049.1 GNAT family N-acetyltransferase [Alteribacter natronophilus]